MDSIFTVDFKYNLGKATAVLCAIYSLPLILAPQIGRELYTSKKPEFKDPEITWKVVDVLTQMEGLCILSCDLTWWLHVVEGMSRDKAIGVASLLWLVFNLNMHSQRGRQTSPEFFPNLLY
jgi:hypothetical protein